MSTNSSLTPLPLPGFPHGTSWDETKPGFAEVDLVSQSTGNERGDFAQSLCLTDVASTWSDAKMVRNNAQVNVFEGLNEDTLERDSDP